MEASENLKWRRVPFHRAPGFVWRLYAGADALADLGGAPCLQQADAPGQVAYVIRDGGAWRGSAEVVPYRSVETSRRRDPERAKADALALVRCVLAAKAAARDASEILATDGSEPPHASTFGEFIAANCDEFGGAETADGRDFAREVWRAIANGGTYHGGGGAAAAFRVWLADSVPEAAR